MRSGIEETTQWFIFLNNETLLLTKDNTLPLLRDIAKLEPYFLRSLCIEKFKDVTYYCAELDTEVLIPESLAALPLRQALTILYEEKYALGVKAYSVMNWDKNHQFCGRCGSATIHVGTGFERLCQHCNLSFFPRISPSVIVLIHNNDHILMARSPHFLPGAYGLIAGFVEIGESLEEAVHREVKEEVGITIKNLSYFSSQPWPFPDSLVVGYMAEYDSGDLCIDHQEIEAAGWYKYDNLPGHPSTSISIASQLLDSFIKSR